MKQVTVTGQTVEDAVESALKELETTKDDVEITVIDEGKKGILGLFGVKPAKVEVKVVIDPVKEAEMFLKKVIEHMGLAVRVDKVKKDKEVTFQLSGEKIAILIGKRGQTLNSLQFLTQLVVNRYTEHHLTVIIDAENYRMKRKETLKGLALRLAEKAKSSNKEVKLEPMPSFERKIIHHVLQRDKFVNTYSDGIEPNRFLVIKPRNNR